MTNTLSKHIRMVHGKKTTLSEFKNLLIRLSPDAEKDLVKENAHLPDITKKVALEIFMYGDKIDKSDWNAEKIYQYANDIFELKRALICLHGGENTFDFYENKAPFTLKELQALKRQIQEEQ
jgi:hypothetical protein